MQRFAAPREGRRATKWDWLVDKGRKLEIVTTSNAGTPMGEPEHGKPLVVLDLWEHAYYVDYRNRREEYIAIQDGLKEPDGLPLDASIRKRLTTTTEESYVAEGLALTIRNYRLAALEGLKLVGSQKALAWLDRTVPTLQDAELARAAKATIDVLRGRHAG